MWDENAWLVPRIRAALDAQVPPTAIILRDPEHKEYGVWDFKLVTALRIYDDMMRGSVPIYWDESDRVAFDVKVGVSKSKAAIEIRQSRDEKKKTNTPGRYYYVTPRVIDGGLLPTREEWIEERMKKMGADKPPQQP